MDAVTVSVRGPVEVIGPQVVVLRGGLGGTYVRTTGETGEASLTLTPGRGEPVTIPLVIEAWKRGQVINP
jgi:beta-galactosidase